jgi:hypothetical protein
MAGYGFASNPPYGLLCLVIETNYFRTREIRTHGLHGELFERVYVLHVLQKKSKRGKQTSQRDIDLIRERLKRASEIYRMKLTENEA